MKRQRRVCDVSHRTPLGMFVCRKSYAGPMCEREFDPWSPGDFSAVCRVCVICMRFSGSPFLVCYGLRVTRGCVPCLKLQLLAFLPPSSDQD